LKSYDKNVYKNGKNYVYFIGFLISAADVIIIRVLSGAKVFGQIFFAITPSLLRQIT